MSTRTPHPKHVAGEETVADEKQRKKTQKDPIVTVVMSQASLETVRVKDRYELVCADTHASILKKLNRSPADFRPDILHQSLLSLLDSPFNKAGMLKVYIHTTSNTLIEVNPQIRIPRTFKRFAGLMVQLLRDLKIKSGDGKDVLMKVVKNPVTQYFPEDALKFQTSVQGELTNVHEFVDNIELQQPVVFMIGAHSHGQAKVDWADKTVAFSQYPSSASVIISRILNAFENRYGVL